MLKTGFVSIVALASVAACVAPVTSSSSEALGQAEQASTATGITASITKTSDTTSQYGETVTVKNNGTAPAYNWQVAINMRESTLGQNVFGASAYPIAGFEVFTPNSDGAVLNPGAEATFSFQGNKTGSHYNPVIESVDGVQSGAAGAVTDHVDHISRAVATAALEMAIAYESNKLSNHGDANYGAYDGLIWSSQSFVISSDGSQIQFDPNVPGYVYIPNQAKAELAFAQQDPSVASYLTAGLASCFAESSGGYEYAFNPAALKGYTFSTHTQTILADAAGNSGVDKFAVLGSTSNGSERVTINETQSSGKDWSFGLLTSPSFWNFPSSITQAVANKYGNGNAIPCSPFNGPGGASANPYLVITLNGSQPGPRTQLAPLQCQNSNCTSSLVIDPVAYATPGQYYDSNNNMVGTQPNPFILDANVVFGSKDHASQFAINPYGQYGTFTTAVTLFGSTKYKYNLCGNPASGC